MFTIKRTFGTYHVIQVILMLVQVLIFPFSYKKKSVKDPVVQLVVSTNAVVKFINAPLNFIVTLNLLFNTSLYLTHR